MFHNLNERIFSLFTSEKKERKLKRSRSVQVSKEISEVPENCVWITREIVVNRVRTHCWFLIRPFDRIYAPDQAVLIDSNIYFKWYRGSLFGGKKGKIKKAKVRNNVKFLNGFDIQKNISNHPVWFSPGTKISTEDPRVILEVDEYKILD